MASVEAELRLNIAKLTSELDRARKEVRSFKAAAEQEGKGLDEALFGRLKGPMNGSAGMFAADRRFGAGLRGGNMAMQQAGFQVADLAVQLEMGTSPMRAFIQQGSQMAGAFGPWGAVIGAAIAVLGSLVPMLFKTGKSAEEVKKEMEALTPAIKAVSEAMNDLATDQGEKQLAAHVRQVQSLLSFYQRVGEQIKSNQDSANDQRSAAESTALADIEKRRASALQGAGSEAEMSRVNDRYDQEARGVQSIARDQDTAAKIAGLTESKQAADQALVQLQDLVPRLKSQLEDTQRGVTSRLPTGLMSDQERLLNKYNDALSSNRAGSTNPEHATVISTIGPILDELRATMDAGKYTFELAANDEEKRLAKNYQSEQAMAQKVAEKLRDEISSAESEIARLKMASTQMAGAIPKTLAEAELAKAKALSDEAGKRTKQASDLDAKVKNAEEDFMSRDQRRAELAAQLNGIFSGAGVEVGDFGKLKSANPEAYVEALSNAKKGAALSQDNGIAMPVGAAANAVNLLTGRGPNQLAQKTNDLLTDIRTYMDEVRGYNKSMDQNIIELQTNPTFMP